MPVPLRVSVVVLMWGLELQSKNDKKDALNKFLAERPTADDLRDKHILETTAGTWYM